MRTQAPFHEGELAVQAKAGESAAAARTGRIIRDRLPPFASGFFGQQRLAVISTVDVQMRPWISLVSGSPGFLQATDETSMILDFSKAWLHSGDPLWTNLERDHRFGMLLIEFATRRRFRVNGTAQLGQPVVRLSVREAFGNCPKYIQRREPTGELDIPGEASQGRAAAKLEPSQQDLMRAADTLFVGSLSPEGNADASHRGGQPGFVQVLGEDTLRIPDYPGNGMFQTLGNFALHPYAGILVPSFSGEPQLQLIGQVEVQWDLGDPTGLTGGTQRFWDFHVDTVIETPMPAGEGWEFLDYSPFNPG
jgi:predicted pyridoxine 5'-phosphate oxidase superfamily flavin-nucleotide-binding protein